MYSRYFCLLLVSRQKRGLSDRYRDRKQVREEKKGKRHSRGPRGGEVEVGVVIMTLEHSDIAAGACFPLFPRKRKVRPPGPEELRTWIKAFPVWERSSSYTWEADYSTLPQRVRGQVKEGSDERKQPFHDGRPAAARGVSSSPAQKPEEASTSSRPKSSSRVVDKSTEDIRIQRAAAAVTSSSFSVSALLSKSARTARHVKENGRQNASRNVSQGVTRNSGVQEVTAERSRKGAIEVIDLSEQVKRRRKSKGDGAASFDMSALFPKSRKTLELPEFVSDLSTREGLEAFEDEMKVGKDMAFSLLLGSKAYGSCPTSKWLNVHSTSSTPLSKEQKRELKVKVGTDFQHMDPDGHVVGMCFMFNGGANFKGEGTLHFLPLCQKEHSSIVVSGAVPLPQRIEVLQDFLNSKHCATCFDLQGILRRLYRCGISSGISSKSRLSCLKLMAWMLEPGLVHDKIIQEYSFKSISQLYQIEVVGEHEDPFSQIAFELKASNMLAKRLCRDDMPNMHLAYLLQVEVQVADLLAQMELVGVSYNLELLDGVKEQIQPHLEKIEKEASNIAGETFNVRSVSQLSKILYERLRAPLINNKTSTDEQRLQALQAYNDVRVSRLCKIVLEHRKASQIISKWIEADWLHKAKHLKGDEGVLQIHCCWNQTATATGRLSASNPNLQAVTKSINRFNCGVMDSSGDSIVNVNIRDAFIPKREKVFLSLDYSQIEIRILAHLR